MNWRDNWTAFVISVSANLVSVAILWLVANISGLVALAHISVVPNVVLILVAFGVITTALYYGLLMRDQTLSGGEWRISGVTSLASFAWLATLALEAISVFRAAGLWTTIWVTAASFLVGSVPVIVISLSRASGRPRHSPTQTNQV